MAPDDRDRNFEKALARHLRSSASPSTDALGSGASERLEELCPDAEILAAYHDGSLSSEERNLWKQHVVGCERCQLVLAHLETPLDLPVHAETNQAVVALKQNASSGIAASPAPIARPSPLHNLRWLWLVPVGAVAATLIAWVSLNTQKPLETASSQPVEVAENRPTPGVAPGAKTARVSPNEATENELKDKEKDQLAAPSAAGAASALRDLDSKQPQSQGQSTEQSSLQASPKPVHGPYVSRQKQEQQQTMGAGARARTDQGATGAELKKSLDAQLSANAGDRLEEVQRPQALPPPPPPPSFIADGSVSRPVAGQAGSVGGAASAPATPAPAPASKAAAPKASAATADSISALSETVEVSAAPQVSANGPGMMRAASLQNPHVFWAPNGKQAWRIGPAGSLEFSKDKGSTWTPQISGVYTDLVAGSAPSGKVCWIAGAAGTILRTTDGGTHWSKLDSPVTNDLTGIHATDAMHASISFVPDQRTGLVTTYETADGGRTWLPATTDH